MSGHSCPCFSTWLIKYEQCSECGGEYNAEIEKELDELCEAQMKKDKAWKEAQHD